MQKCKSKFDNFIARDPQITASDGARKIFKDDKYFGKNIKKINFEKYPIYIAPVIPVLNKSQLKQKMGTIIRLKKTEGKLKECAKDCIFTKKPIGGKKPKSKMNMVKSIVSHPYDYPYYKNASTNFGYKYESYLHEPLKYRPLKFFFDILNDPPIYNPTIYNPFNQYEDYICLRFNLYEFARLMRSIEEYNYWDMYFLDKNHDFNLLYYEEDSKCEPDDRIIMEITI